MKNRPRPFSWFFFNVALLLCFALTSAPVAWACSGPPIPPDCPRSIYLAKFAPCTVLLPASGAITVPIGALPFVSWSKQKGCPQPTAATLTFNLSCVPAGGGAAIPFGPFMVPVKKPANPGPQPLPGPLNVVIPAASAGPLQTGGPFICTVTGTYTVKFPPPAQGGNGGGDISGTGDVEVCLVPPAVGGDQTVPRLDMCVVPVDKKGVEFFPTCRRGDQGIVYYLITNNDPTNKATLTLTSDGKQTAGVPDGSTAATAYAAGFFAIAHPGSDVYAAAFADLITPAGSLLPEADPTVMGTGNITRMLTLDPLKSSIVGIATRSGGHCLDGSCNERNLKATGTFADASTAIACASSGALVGSVHPKSPLCEFGVNINTSRKRDADWFIINFETTGGNIPHGSVFVVGNQPPGQPAFTKLDAPAFPHRFPTKASDYYRTDQPVTGMNYQVRSYVGTGDVTTNHVMITGMNGANAPAKFAIPVILANPLSQQGDFDVFVDIAAGMIAVKENMPANMTFQPKPLKDFLRSPPTGLSIEKGTSLQVTEICKNTLPVISVDPLGATANIMADGTTTNFAVVLHPDPMKQNEKWHAALLPAFGTKLEKGSDLLANPIKVDLLIKHTMPFPADNISILNVTFAGAINSPFRVPIDVRVLPGP